MKIYIANIRLPNRRKRKEQQKINTHKLSFKS